jgi:hypothetical protein
MKIPPGHHHHSTDISDIPDQSFTQAPRGQNLEANRQTENSKKPITEGNLIRYLSSWPSQHIHAFTHKKYKN